MMISKSRASTNGTLSLRTPNFTLTQDKYCIILVYITKHVRHTNYMLCCCFLSQNFPIPDSRAYIDISTENLTQWSVPNIKVHYVCALFRVTEWRHANQCLIANMHLEYMRTVLYISGVSEICRSKPQHICVSAYSRFQYWENEWCPGLPSKA